MGSKQNLYGASITRKRVHFISCRVAISSNAMKTSKRVRKQSSKLLLSSKQDVDGENAGCGCKKWIE